MCVRDSYGRFLLIMIMANKCTVREKKSGKIEIVLMKSHTFWMTLGSRGELKRKTEQTNAREYEIRAVSINLNNLW